MTPPADREEPLEAVPPGQPRRRFAAKVLWYVTTYGTRSFFSILSVFVTTHFLKARSYGVYSQVLAVCGVLGQLPSFGMPRRLGVWLLQHPAGKSRAQALWSVLIMVWTLGGLCLLLIVPLVLKYYSWLDPEQAKTLLYMVFVGEIARTTVVILKIQLEYDEDVRRHFVLELSCVLLPVTLGCSILVASHLDLIGYVAGVQLGWILTVLGILVHLSRTYAPSIDLGRVREALGSGPIMFLPQLTWSGVMMADRLLLGALGAGPVAVGYYQLALNAAAVAGGMSVTMSTMVVRHVFRSGRTPTADLAMPALFSLLAAPLYSVVLAAGAPLIFRIIVAEEYHPALPLVAPLVWVQSLFIGVNLGLNAFLERGLYMKCLAFEVLALALSLVVNASLIPVVGSWACVLALGVSYLVTGAALLGSRGIFAIPGAGRALAQTGLLWIVCGAVVAWITQSYSPREWLEPLLCGLTIFAILASIVLTRTGKWGLVREGMSFVAARFDRTGR